LRGHFGDKIWIFNLEINWGIPYLLPSRFERTFWGIRYGYLIWKLIGEYHIFSQVDLRGHFGDMDF